jgi:transposase
MPRTHGYSLKGQRCYGVRAWGERGRINVIGALLENQLITVSLFEGTINSATFTSWIEQDLIPKLPNNSVVVMDNATFHKDKIMQEQLFLAGFTLEYLPPYSPDLNPIEHKWAQAKSIRRKTNCTIDELFQTHCQ